MQDFLLPAENDNDQDEGGFEDDRSAHTHTMNAEQYLERLRCSADGYGGPTEGFGDRQGLGGTISSWDSSGNRTDLC